MASPDVDGFRPSDKAPASTVTTTLRVAGSVQAAEIDVGEEGEDLALDLLFPAGHIRLLLTQHEARDLVLRIVGRIAR
jgi:hypothetical protein